MPEGGGAALTEMPGGILADGGIGLPESPAGMLAGSSLISLLMMTFALEFEVVFDWLFEPQPNVVTTMTEQTKINAFLNILMAPYVLK